MNDGLDFTRKGQVDRQYAATVGDIKAICGEVREGFYCTRVKDHPDLHGALDFGYKICAEWK